MKRMLFGVAALVVATLLGCTSTPAPESRSQAQDQHQQARTTLSQLKQTDPSLQAFLDNAYAYAIFPRITAGALGVGGAHGKGEVYRGGQLIGYADLTQANIGLQAGGQEFSELIVFQNEAAFNDFRNGQLAFDARASAVAAASGAASSANYQRGVAVFTLTQGGLMAQAAIGGQSFRYQPVSGMATDRP